MKFTDIAIKGVAAAVPKQVVDNADYPHLSVQEKELAIKNIGIAHRRIAPKGMTAGDLCAAAAARLLDSLNWKAGEIRVLVFVSQTPDYLTPCTAAILQDRLGLPTSCLAFDINLGCSAYPYSLSVVAALLSAMPGAKGLLLVGDKSSQLVAEEDKSTALLFSDVGSATALQQENGAPPMCFDLSTDGSGFSALMVKGGAARHPFSKKSLEKEEISQGIVRNELNLILKGIDIFKFSLSRVPPSIQKLLKFAGKDIAEVDYFLLHQANKMINNSIRKRLQMPGEKFPSTLYDFGNGGSASIPLTWVVALGKKLAKGQHDLLLAGFGVGLSWGTGLVSVSDLPPIPLVET